MHHIGLYYKVAHQTFLVFYMNFENNKVKDLFLKKKNLSSQEDPKSPKNFPKMSFHSSVLSLSFCKNLISMKNLVLELWSKNP